MDPLVLANITDRPTRAAASVFGVAIGIVLIVVTSGLVRGMLGSTAKREGAVGAELLFQPPGSLGAGLTTTPLSLPVAYATVLARLDGVRATTPVGRYVRTGAGGLGFELVEGIEFEPSSGYESYAAITGMRVVEGRAPVGDREIVIDRQRAADGGAGVGSSIELFGRRFTVVGIFEPEVGARIKLSLASLQELLGTEGKCSSVLIKTSSPEVQEAVAVRVDEAFPGNQIVYTRDIPSFVAKGMPSLNVFLDVVMWLATAISGLVVLLAMYTAVSARTREIGILKSLGASRRFIVTIIEKEALTISTLGIVVGLVLSLVVGASISHWTTLVVELDPLAAIKAGSVVLLSGALGAFYPSLQAAKQDAVEALSHE
jgi:putative ABC transport system permease protein